MPAQKTIQSRERRQVERATRVLAIRHCLVRRHAKKAVSSCSLSTTRNMSATGLLFWSDIPYKPGDILHINVVMSGVIDIYSGNAKVVRVVENGDTSFDIAVQYIPKKGASRPAKSHL